MGRMRMKKGRKRPLMSIILTVTNADGTTSTIDTNATTGYVTDGTIDIDDDGTPDNNVTIQQALELWQHKLP